MEVSVATAHARISYGSHSHFRGRSLRNGSSSVNRQPGNNCRLPMTNSHYSRSRPSGDPSSPPAPRSIGSLNVVCILYLPSFYRSLFALLGFAFWPRESEVGGWREELGELRRIMRLINMRVRSECGTPPIAPPSPHA